MKWKAGAEKLRKLWDRYKYVLLVAAAGVILLLWPSGGGSGLTGGGSTGETLRTAAGVDSGLSALEEEMEEILSRIDGVGELHLMLTLETGESLELAENGELTARSEGEYSQSREPLVLSGDDGEETVVTRRLAPICRGALVVCSGGENPEVRLAVTEAVSALTGLRSDRITVIKCQ